MTNGIPTAVQMGFAEFTAKLIADTFEAVTVAMAQQETEFLELTRLAELPPEAFAQQAIADEDLETGLAQLFPGDEEHPHAVYVGAPYQPETSKTAEAPPFAALLGVTLTRDDWLRRNTGIVLKETGVDKVRTATRTRLGLERYAALRQLLTRGLPRVLVDSGRINAKLTFEVTDVEESTSTASISAATPAATTIEQPTLTRPVTTLTPLNRFVGLVRPFPQPNVRLLVRQVDTRDPQNTQVKVNIFSEVEITFKTVT